MSIRQSPPYAKWTESDHAGPIIIVTTVSLIYWTVAGVGQQVLSATSGLRYTWADAMFTFAMVMGLVQSTLILVGTSNGLGKSASVIQPGNLQTAEQMYKVTNIFYVLTLGSIKCSATCFIANLMVYRMGSLRHIPRKKKIILYGILALATIWVIGSVVAFSYPCDAYGGSTSRDGMCMGTVSRWVGVFVGDAITDIVVVVYAASVIWQTKAPIGKRLSWYLPFIVRGIIPLWSGLRLVAIDKSKLTQDSTIALWLFISMSQVQILLALIGTASPALKKAMMDLATNWGHQTASGGSNSGGGQSFGLKYIKKRSQGSKGSSQPLNTSSGSRHIPFSGPGIGSSAFASINKHDKRVRSDGDSQEGIIRQDDFVVSYFQDDSTSRDQEDGEGTSR